MHRYSVFFIVLILSGFVLKAQTNNPLLYILHEGTLNNKGTIGVLNLNNFQYAHLDSIESFGNDLLVQNDKIYVVEGSGNVLIYQRNPFQLLKSILNVDARQIKLYQNQLLMTCSVAPFFKVYDLVGDSIFYVADTNDVRAESEGLWVENDKAYILVNAYGSDSQLVVWNLLTKSKIKTLNTAINPNDFIKVDNSLFFNCLDYITGSITIQKLDLSLDSITLSRTINITSFGGLTAKSNNEILFSNNDNFMVSSIARWNISTDVVDTHYVNMANAYALNYHIPTQTFFYSITDYISSGSIKIQSTSVDTLVNTYIAPRRLVFFQEVQTSTEKMAFTESKIYPNPALDYVNLTIPEDYQSIEIYNLEGKVVYKTEQKIEKISVRDWDKGIYLLVIKTRDKILSHKFRVE